MRKLASIQKIVDLQPIPNADRIEVATILGWQCIVKKGEFQVGDLCVYFEIDSILPEKPVFEFMRDRKFRVRTIKLRKCVSMGLALPIKDVFTGTRILEEGDDVTKILGVKKYDPEGDREKKLIVKGGNKKRFFLFEYLRQYAWFRNLLHKFGVGRKRNFPQFISKTDEERVQNMPNVFKQKAGTVCYMTEKLDGQSATYAIYKNKFYVCSRNLTLYKNDGSAYWKIAEMYDIEKKLRNSGYKNIAIQTENCGPGIQKNKYKLDKLTPFVFNIKDLDKEVYLNKDEKTTWCDIVGINHVPIISYEFLLTEDMDVNFMVDKSKGKSMVGKCKREGIVIRGIINDKFSFKCINPEFLLQYEGDE